MTSERDRPDEKTEGNFKMDRSALDAARYTLFDENGVGATDFKMFPGGSRDSTPEQVAEEVTKAVAQIAAGDFDDLDDDPDA